MRKLIAVVAALMLAGCAGTPQEAPQDAPQLCRGVLPPQPTQGDVVTVPEGWGLSQGDGWTRDLVVTEEAPVWVLGECDRATVVTTSQGWRWSVYVTEPVEQ